MAGGKLSPSHQVAGMAAVPHALPPSGGMVQPSAAGGAIGGGLAAAIGGIGGLGGGAGAGGLAPAAGAIGGGGPVDPELALQQRNRRKMGGSYSTYTGPSPNNGYGGSNGTALGGIMSIALNNDGVLVDSSGRRIKTDGYTAAATAATVGGMEVADSQSRQ